ncbi:MAG: lipase [Clostridia bacterium]|nr:lipase [Clostridia bacterium]
MNEHWIAAWGSAIAKTHRRAAEWMHDTTVRLELKMTVPGTALRFQFSNLFGKEDAVITKATVGIADGNKMDPHRWVPITFEGNQSGTVAAGQGLTSDAADLEFEAGECLSLNLYFADFTQLITGHTGGDAFHGRWVANGDQTEAEELPATEYMDGDVFPFIHTVEALVPEDCYSIVTFGDSITAQTWPDRLKRRVEEELGRKDVAIVRKAISGSRVLREYPCDLYRHYGPKGHDRFEREVCLPGVKKVFILHGINDIIHPTTEGKPFRPITDQPTAEELIEGLMFYINKAHEHGIAVFLSPILPFEGWRTYNEEKEAIRQKVNYWIYREAPVEGVLPFELALLNPDSPLSMQAQYDSGDHLHPSGNGAQAMADSIPEEFI